MGHTAELLYALRFRTGRDAERFVTSIREALATPGMRRKTPPGPLVIYGPFRLADRKETTVFVTAGILRAAEVTGLRVERGEMTIAGAEALPPGAVTLFATLGGDAMTEDSSPG